MTRELVFILGGARAGKSHLAQKLAQSKAEQTGSSVCFIATAEALDEDMQARIVRHREERPATWRTIEEPRALAAAYAQAADAGVVLVDCLTLLVSNWLMTMPDAEADCLKAIETTLAAFLQTFSRRHQTVIVVSNEVGLGIVPDNALARRYRDLLGNVNQTVAAAATEVYFVVAGLPWRIK
ncbi:bifunctional adenosylcobinamide kinase/adenosylcobinamide-phosphate guanylyltransferase [Chloracidobacterium validum]|uniref:Adenosylcobinamide kinase n=1 Tax=Chloracidobacterium validum TaxID=2821543 RepID=A0ABX8B5S9_9BACT|nr:bifunctional adenosylcobinamide kinase/adenosylcobinamide-phosphate guanylyltransferase [Chloracidobacterium validum]QUW02283.1 bifunctional adenosylcobinamide kinase/adenosylcobinamide-phosphate guanylyltransferase [Chloracidobacterium validum]